jgi:hypothetical protein
MTIAKQLNITTFPFEIKDAKGRLIYSEDSDGYWIKRKYDQYGNQIYYENSNGYWEKVEFDQNGNQIYFENSDGYIADNRPKPEPEVKQETLEEAAAKYIEAKWEPAQEENRESFIEGAKSEAARDYWFEQFKKKGGDK